MPSFAHRRLRPALAAAALACVAGSSCAGPGTTEGPGAAGRGVVQLQVASTPSGARIILDGKATGFRTPTGFPVQPGEHRVTMTLAGHQNADLRVRLAPGKPQRVAARLSPLAAGALHVTSAPAGAEVFIDGDPTGRRTPATIDNLAIGTHTVMLRRPGSEDWVQAVVVTQNRTLSLQGALAPVRGSLGGLAVQSQPPRASIAIDGRPTGRTTPAQIAGLPAGVHRIELALEDHRPWSGTATVREGRTESLLVALRHLPAREVGSARIETDPPGAAITLNGTALRQKTPADLGGLAPGVWEVTLTRPGARPWSGQLTVEPGKRTRLEIRLQPRDGTGGAGAPEAPHADPAASPAAIAPQ